MSICTKSNCGMTTSGCADLYCPMRHTIQQMPQPFQYLPPGCICPPTSEQTCKSPTCPRGGGQPLRTT